MSNEELVRLIQCRENYTENMLALYDQNKGMIYGIARKYTAVESILLLKGVNAYYAKKRDDVYYSFKEAYKHYSAGETSRYWIKKDLLEENIQYTFTELGIYKTGYDMSFLPAECRQPLTIFENDQSIASGIQRTGDLHLNLPLI